MEPLNHYILVVDFTDNGRIGLVVTGISVVAIGGRRKDEEAISNTDAKICGQLM
jgi:hypothetical protein